MTIFEMVAIQLDPSLDAEPNSQVMPSSEASMLSGLATLMNSEQISETITRMIALTR